MPNSPHTSTTSYLIRKQEGLIPAIELHFESVENIGNPKIKSRSQAPSVDPSRAV